MSQSGGPLRVAVLGPMLAWLGDEEVRIGAAQQQVVLGILALRANQVVTRSELIDAVWGEDPPASAENGVHTYVARLRRILEPGRGHRRPGQVLASTNAGYILHLQAGRLDLEIFERTLDRAGRLAAAGELTGAIGAFDTALELWRGQPFAGTTGPFVETERTRLVELLLAAREERAEVLLALGRHAELVARLPALIHEWPFRESLRGLLMRALYHGGRQAEALSVFQEVRQVLVDELGIEPTRDLRRLHQQILNADPALDPPSTVALVIPPTAGPARGRAPQRSPAQLPHDVTSFTGRNAELAELVALGTSTDAGLPASTVVISAIDGAAGIGKTALAVHVAHQISHRFPDGQLFLNLRGFDPHQPPLSAHEALGHLLWSLGLDQRHVPRDLDQRAGLYRSLLADRRVLVLLDNAVAADQIRPLLPGTPTCLVLVTSRSRLGGLVARDGAHRITLDTLSPEEAQDLLVRTVGAERVAAEPDAAAELAMLCGYLPLALRIAADRIAIRPHLTLADLVGMLGVERHRLDMLAADDDEITAVRAVFSWSYQALSADAARVFRLLGLHAGQDFSAQAAAALADLEVEQVRRLVDSLASVHLLEETYRGRYRFHDLLRLYAAECAAHDETESDRAEAVRRLLAWYLHTTDAADRVLAPQRMHLPMESLQTACQPLAFASRQDALDWCETECANLVAASQQAVDVGFDSIAWKLPVTLWSFFSLRKRWADWISSHQIALAAARRLHDRYAESHALNNLGSAYYDLRRLDDAVAHYQLSEAISRELSDDYGRATALNNLGEAYRDMHRYDEAIDCLRRALMMSRGIGDRYGEGFALHTLGGAYRDLRRFDEAIDCLRQALTVSGEINDRWDEGFALHSLGETYRDLGRLDEAINYLHHALTLRGDIGDRQGQGMTLHTLGTALRDNGQPRMARESWQRALAIFEDLDDPHRGEVLTSLATLGFAGADPLPG